MNQMTPRQRVYASLDCNLHGRVPRQLWTLPWAELNYPRQLKEIRNAFPDDIVECPEFLRRQPAKRGDPHTAGAYVDEWGCRWTNIQDGITGEIKEPLVRTLDDLTSLRLPEETLSVDTDAVNDFCRHTNAFVLQPSGARPFERMQFLRTAPQLYVDLADESRGFTRLLAMVHGHYLRSLEAWAATDVDALVFMDDWGSQNSLLISPQMWRRLFKPLYRDYINIAHANGKRIFMHSDGYIAAIIPDLIELGLDALNCQIFCMGLQALEQFRGRICFWGEIDRQHLLPYGTRNDIREAVRAVHSSLSQCGGVIAQCEFGVGANPDNVATVFETWDSLT